jgi:hypothetical protein
MGCDFLKREPLHWAGSSKGLHFNMAICEKFNFIVRAWASEGHHDGVSDAFQIELDSGILQL